MHLSVTAMNEDHRHLPFGGEVVDALARARPVGEIQVVGMPQAHLWLRERRSSNIAPLSGTAFDDGVSRARSWRRVRTCKPELEIAPLHLHYSFELHVGKLAAVARRVHSRLACPQQCRDYSDCVEAVIGDATNERCRLLSAPVRRQ